MTAELALQREMQKHLGIYAEYLSLAPLSRFESSCSTLN